MKAKQIEMLQVTMTNEEQATILSAIAEIDSVTSDLLKRPKDLLELSCTLAGAIYSLHPLLKALGVDIQSIQIEPNK